MISILGAESQDVREGAQGGQGPREEWALALLTCDGITPRQESLTTLRGAEAIQQETIRILLFILYGEGKYFNS